MHYKLTEDSSYSVVYLLQSAKENGDKYVINYLANSLATDLIIINRQYEDTKDKLDKNNIARCFKHLPKDFSSRLSLLEILKCQTQQKHGKP